MRLLREEPDMVPMDTAEYKTAIKSVIRCQIQTLLQKLASETGEESILISTNVATGTYNHLGSYMGREYLQDGDTSIQTVCQKFIHFCAGMKNNSMVIPSDSMAGQAMDASGRPTHQLLKRMLEQNTNMESLTTDIHIGEIASRKRLLESSLSQNLKSPPSKKRPLKNNHGGGLVPEYSSQKALHSDTSLTTSQPGADNSNKKMAINDVSWIKIEPQENFETGEERNADSCEKASTGAIENHENQDKPSLPNGNFKPVTGAMKRKSRPFIPLASIFSKFGNVGKTETEKIESEMGENSVSSREGEATVSNLEPRNEEESHHLRLPVTVSDATGASENLVLSGYYDNDDFKNVDRKIKLTNMVSSSQQTKDLIPGEPVLKMSDSPGRLVYECHICHRELSHLTSYRRHMKIHSLDRPHKCPVCGKGFIRKYHCLHHLNKHHLKSQSPDMDTRSPGVGNSSAEAAELDQSSDDLVISRHLYNAPLLFDQSAGSSTDLDQSVSDMTVGKTESCSSDSSPGVAVVVSRECSPRNDKVVHENPVPEHLRKIADLEHMGCILCSKNFPSMNSLLRHLYTHSAGQTFTCEICDTDFNKKHLYTAHVISEHGTEVA